MLSAPVERPFSFHMDENLSETTAPPPAAEPHPEPIKNQRSQYGKGTTKKASKPVENPSASAIHGRCSRDLIVAGTLAITSRILINPA
jgi:hypothetical protein